MKRIWFYACGGFVEHLECAARPAAPAQIEIASADKEADMLGKSRQISLAACLLLASGTRADPEVVLPERIPHTREMPQGTLLPPVSAVPLLDTSGEPAVAPSAIAQLTPPPSIAPSTSRPGVIDGQMTPTASSQYPMTPIRSRFTVRYDHGDGVGYEEGYSYVEGFVPLRQNRGSLFFGNLRVVNFNSSDIWEFNGGLGVRKYNSCTDRVVGFHAHYDGRTTRAGNYFNQVTLGFESLGKHLDIRGNAYLPIGDRRQLIADGGFVNPRFQGNTILLDRSRLFEVALRGCDFEIGTPVPGLQKWDVRAFAGGYHYSAEGTPEVNGVRGRLEANPHEMLSLFVSIQNDDVFDTTLHGGFALHFGPGRRTRSLPGGSVEQRMGDRVVRDPNIVVGTSLEVTQTVATDPTTGQAILVRHANSAAGPEGDGTVERPYQTLSALEKGSVAGEILFVHGGSVFVNDPIQLQTGQRFLGEGTTHTFSSQQGKFLLPRATQNNTAPLLLSEGAPPGFGFSFDGAVNLANHTEVAGFTIKDSFGDAILGTEITSALIRNNTIMGAGRSAIRLTDVAGNIEIVNNVFVDSRFEALFISQGEGNLNLRVADNVFSNSGSCQLVYQGFGDSVLSATIERNSFDQNQCVRDIDIVLFEEAKAAVTISENTLRDSPSVGIELSTFGDSALTAHVTGNRILAAGNTGINVFSADNSTTRVQIARNTILDSSFSAIAIAADGDANMGAQIFGNVVNADILLSRTGSATFVLEDTLGTNTLMGGAATNVDAGIAIVPFGSLGFPPP